MSSNLNAIEAILELKLTDSILNHYSLLHIAPDSSVEEIKSALKRAASLWNANHSKVDAIEAQKIASMLKTAQAELLDSVKRRAYDERLAKNVVATPNSSARESVSGNSVETRVKESKKKNPRLFPSGDPLAPFNPVEWEMPTELYSFGSVSQRIEELQEVVLAGFELHPVEAKIENQSSSFFVNSTHRDSDNSSGTRAASMLVEQLKRKRQRNQRLVLGAIFTAAFALLLFASARFFLNQQQVAELDKTKKERVDPFSATGGMKLPDKGLKTAPPIRSDLPSLRASDGPSGEMENPISAMEGKMGGSANMGTMEGQGDATMRTPGSGDSMDTSSTPGTIPVSNPPVGSAPPASIGASSPESEGTKMSSSDTSEGGGTKEMVSESVTKASKKDWSSAMKEGRNALEKLDFSAFEKAMEKVVSMPADTKMTEQYKRLDQFGQLYKISVEAMREAKSKMKGTETLTYGKNQISIVEVKENELVVRSGGTNQRYPWNKLPLAVAMAMADLSLSSEDPVDIAARAIYLKMSPTKNELSEKKIKELFEKSLGKGDIRKDLDQVLTDKYE